jgi:hypothetical protein
MALRGKGGSHSKEECALRLGPAFVPIRFHGLVDRSLIQPVRSCLGPRANHGLG